jgi:predicted transcriptional regulator
MKTETSKNKTGNGNQAQAALANINRQIEELTKQRVTLAAPLKEAYLKMRSDLSALEGEIKGLDKEWRPEPMKAKAETKIAEILTAKGQPMTAEEIVAAVGDLFTGWKVKNVLKKKSTGAKAVFTLADGKYAVKAAAA